QDEHAETVQLPALPEERGLQRECRECRETAEDAGREKQLQRLGTVPADREIARDASYAERAKYVHHERAQGKVRSKHPGRRQVERMSQRPTHAGAEEDQQISIDCSHGVPLSGGRGAKKTPAALDASAR